MSTVQLFTGSSLSDVTPSIGAGPQYMFTHGNTDWGPGATPRDRRNLRFPVPGILSNLHTEFDGVPGIDCEYALENFSTDPANERLLVEIDSAATEGNSGSQRVHIAAGDDFHVRLQGSGGGAAQAIKTKHSFLFVPDVTAEFVYGGCSVSNLLSNSATNWCALLPALPFSASQFHTRFLCPIAGTVKMMYTAIQLLPGEGKSWTFTFYKNEVVQTALTTTHANTRNENDSVHSFTVVPNDVITVESVPSGSPTVTYVRISFVIVPDDGESAIWATVNAVNLTITGTRFTHPWTQRLNDTTVSDVDTLCFPKGNEFELTALYIRLSAPPGGGIPVRNWAFESWKNGVEDTDIKVTITGGVATTGNDSGSIFLNNGDVFALGINPSGDKGGGQPALTRCRTAYALRHVRKPTVRILGGRIKGGRIATL